MNMDISIVDPATGVIENVIVAQSIEHAQQLFPDKVCIARGNQMHEPGATLVSAVLTRASVIAPEVNLEK